MVLVRESLRFNAAHVNELRQYGDVKQGDLMLGFRLVQLIRALILIGILCSD